MRLRDQVFDVLVHQDAAFFDAPEHARGNLNAHLATDPTDATGLAHTQMAITVQAASLIGSGCGMAMYFCPKLGGLMLGISPVTAFSGK